MSRHEIRSIRCLRRILLELADSERLASALARLCSVSTNSPLLEESTSRRVVSRQDAKARLKQAAELPEIQDSFKELALRLALEVPAWDLNNPTVYSVEQIKYTVSNAVQDLLLGASHLLTPPRAPGVLFWMCSQAQDQFIRSDLVAVQQRLERKIWRALTELNSRFYTDTA